MKIGTINGIKIKLHISTFLIVALIGYTVAQMYFFLAINPTIYELILIGLLNGFLILISILIHELLHSIVAQKYGLNVSEIELYVFGGASKIEKEPATPKSEILIAGVGPLSSLMIGGIFLLLLFLPFNYGLFFSVTFYYMGLSNILLGIFNLLPGFPMDGGRILRALIWSRRKDLLSATKTASRIGRFFGYLLIFIGIYMTFFYSFLAGIWMILIGFFLTNAARSEYIQTVASASLAKTSAKEISTLQNIAIDFNTSILNAIRNFFLRFKKNYFPVELNHTIVGILFLDDIRKIPFNEQENIRVGDAMHPIDDYPSVYEEESGELAYNKLKSTQVRPHIILVRNRVQNKVIGFIGDENIRFVLNYTQS